MGLFNIFIGQRAKKGLPADLQGREGANERPCPRFPKDAIIPEWLKGECCMRSQAREVSLPILGSIMFSSISVVPFDSEPYSTSPIYTPYISDSPSVARENEPSTHSREATCPGSGVNRGARGGHTGGPVGPLETLVKVGRRRVFGEPRFNFSFELRGQSLRDSSQSPGPQLRSNHALSPYTNVQPRSHSCP